MAIYDWGCPILRWIYPWFERGLPSGKRTQSTLWKIVIFIPNWRFPEMRVPPVIIHFHGIFHEINHPASWGTPMTSWKPLNQQTTCHFHPFSPWEADEHPGAALPQRPRPMPRPKSRLRAALWVTWWLWG